MNWKFYILVLGTLCAILWSCREEPPMPYNPYDDIIYPVENVPTDTLSATSLTRTHQEVFEPKCNVWVVMTVVLNQNFELHKAHILL